MMILLRGRDVDNGGSQHVQDDTICLAKLVDGKQEDGLQQAMHAVHRYLRIERRSLINSSAAKRVLYYAASNI